MSQTWYLLNMTDRAHNCNGRLRNLIFSDHKMLYQMLRVCSLPRSFDTWLDRGYVARQPGPFGKLPTEMIEMIFENLINENMPGDVALFAITCKKLLAIGKPSVLQHLRNIHSPWAFGRLICLGESTQDKDLPKGLLTDEQRAEIAAAEIKDVPKEQTSLYKLAAKLYTDDHMRIVRYIYSRNAGQVWFENARKGAAQDAKQLFELDLLEELYRESSQTCPSGGVAVLCNVSKAEYVREDKMKIARYPYLDKGGLVHALLSRICWSPDDSIGMPCEETYRKRLINGPWAGDRFCITTLEEMPRARWGKTWKDVTGEVDELLVHLWEQNMD